VWERYDVYPRRSQRKTLQHPTVGKITLHQEVLNLSDDGLRLNVYQAQPGSADETALTLLSLNGSDLAEAIGNHNDSHEARDPPPRLTTAGELSAAAIRSSLRVATTGELG
jgi:MmyB-like transcription regulator ligand binding domain